MISNVYSGASALFALMAGACGLVQVTAAAPEISGRDFASAPARGRPLKVQPANSRYFTDGSGNSRGQTSRCRGNGGRRIELAKQCGPTAVINSECEDPLQRARRLTNGGGFHVVVECAGQPAGACLAAQQTCTRGRLILMGVFDGPAPLNLADSVFREKRVTGSMSGYGYYDESIAMTTEPRFQGEDLITGRIRLDDLVEKCLKALLNEKRKHVKILVSPQ